VEYTKAITVLEFMSFCENSELGFAVNESMEIQEIWFLDGHNMQRVVDLGGRFARIDEPDALKIVKKTLDKYQ